MVKGWRHRGVNLGGLTISKGQENIKENHLTEFLQSKKNPIWKGSAAQVDMNENFYLEKKTDNLMTG